MAFKATFSKLIDYVGKVSLEHISSQTRKKAVQDFCERMEKEVRPPPLDRSLCLVTLTLLQNPLIKKAEIK